MTDIAWAYRKAKADCFLERAISVSEAFADYEENLSENLGRLLDQLKGEHRSRLLDDDLLRGEVCLIPKNLGVKPRTKSSKRVGGHFSDRGRETPQ